MKNVTVLKCKNQFTKIDEEGKVMYKCELNNEPSVKTEEMRAHFEKIYPDRKFIMGNGECPYGYMGKENECSCCDK